MDTLTAKKTYRLNPDKWVVYGHTISLNRYWKIDDVQWNGDMISDFEYILISKKHEPIADAVIASPDVGVEYFVNLNVKKPLTSFIIKGLDFIRNYLVGTSDKVDFKIKQNITTQVNSMEDLNELPIVGPASREGYEWVTYALTGANTWIKVYDTDHDDIISILKEHEEIADAVIAGSKAEWLNPHIGFNRWEDGRDFFTRYNHELKYRLKEIR